MYARLAIGNAKRSIKDYLIYFITITLCVSLFYAFTSLSSSSYELITEDSYNFKMLQQILKYSTYIITALLVVLIGYVNKYMMRRRQKEFATYILLGTEQKSVALMFFIETLIIGIISIILGIFIGTLFSQVVTALVLITAKQEIIFSFKLYLDTIAITFIFFISMFCVIGLYNVKALRKVKLIDMLNAEKKIEFQSKRSNIAYIMAFITSIILYIICGYCSYKIIKAINNAEGIHIVVGLMSFIIGTYALFYSLAYIIIFIKNKWTNFKYEYTNLFLIGSIISKIKTAPILMATISITFLGAALSFTVTLIMSQWSLGYLEYRVPFDINIGNYYNKTIDVNDISKLDYKEVAEYLINEDYNVEEYCQVEKYFLNDDNFYKKSNMNISAIGVSDFNKLREMLGYEKVSLDNNEFTMQWERIIDDTDIKDYIKENSNININGQELKISSTPYYKESIGERIYNSYAIIILPDSICKNLTVAATDFYANTKKAISYDKAVYLENEYIPKWFKENNKELINKYGKGKDNNSVPHFIQTRMKVVEVSEILNVTLAMRILGIYLGAVLLMISLTVLALQQLVDSIEHKERFKTLKKLGIDTKEINKIILKQISIYFIIPISIAIIGFITFIYNYTNIFRKQINSYIGDKAFALNIGISLVLIISIYICYFIGTYYTFKRNIREREL